MALDSGTKDNTKAECKKGYSKGDSQFETIDKLPTALVRPALDRLSWPLKSYHSRHLSSTLALVEPGLYTKLYISIIERIFWSQVISRTPKVLESVK